MVASGGQRLDRASIGAWLRSMDALPATIRRLQVGSLALADGSVERSSLLAELRKSAAVGEHGFYSYERWESLQVAEGSAEVANRMAVELGDRVRLGAEVERIEVGSRCSVRLASGEELRAEAVVSALPAPVAARLESTASTRSASAPSGQRHALAAKVVAVYPRSVWGTRARTASRKASTSWPRPGRSGRACSRPSCHRSGSRTCSR